MADFPVTIRRQNRKSLVMRLTTSGLLVLIPRWMKPDHPQVQHFVAVGLKKLEGRIPLNTPHPQITPAELKDFVTLWSTRLGVAPKRLQMRQMYRKWGSCSRTGTITLNEALCFVPPHLAEYVVFHELVHLREFNHGAGFKALMSQHMPDWQARDKELNRYLILRPA